jgi:outer membrane protein assembly factor BamA
VYDTSQINGFEDGVDVLEFSPTFIYDSRDTEAITSKGVYLDMFGGYALPTSFDEGFWHYGATLATFINLYQQSRTLSVRALLEGVQGDGEDIPFSDLVRLGGPMRLRGYQLDQFRDNLAAVGTLEYRYPVHERLSGELFVDAGRVGRDYPEVFDRDGLRDFNYGAGLGFVFHDSEKVNFKIEAAYGDGFYCFFSSDPVDHFRDKHKRL